MNESTFTKMKQMKLYGMHGAFKTAVETGKTDHYKKFQNGGVCHDLTQFLIAFADFLQNLDHIGVDGAVGNENENDA